MKESSLPNYENLQKKWRKIFAINLPEYPSQINDFFKDQKFGFAHSYKVLSKARLLKDKIEEKDNVKLNGNIIEELSVFHDIGKFFQTLHSFGNIDIAKKIYTKYATVTNLDPSHVKIVLDGIEGSDFSNKRLFPSGHAPCSIEGEIVQAADKMLDNLTEKVDRYYYYGVNKRGATFFDPNLTNGQRTTFSFDNFSGDQLNVILAILGRRPEDFSHPVIQEEYGQWSKSAKKKVIARILNLSREIGESKDNIELIKQTIIWYRKTFNC